MKKVALRIISALCLIAISVGLFSGCMDKPGGGGTNAPAAADKESGQTGTSAPETGYEPETLPPLTEDEVNELKDAGLREYEGVIRVFDGDKAVGSHRFTRYYGTYSGYAVVYEDGMLQARWSFTVAGKEFRGNHSFQLYACRGGEVITLSEAYNRDLLTEEDIAEIHKLHSGSVGGTDSLS